MANPYRRRHPLALLATLLLVAAVSIVGGRALATSNACQGVAGQGFHRAWQWSPPEYRCTH